LATVTKLLFRLALLTAGILFAAGIGIAFVFALAFWSARVMWAVLTGRSAPVFVRWRRASAFAAMMRDANTAQAQRARGGPRPVMADVTDVEARPVKNH
jgi:hypothetical protein